MPVKPILTSSLPPVCILPIPSTCGALCAHQCWPSWTQTTCLLSSPSQRLHAPILHSRMITMTMMHIPPTVMLMMPPTFMVPVRLARS